MSEWLKEMGCKPIGSAYAGSNPAPPIPQPSIRSLSNQAACPASSWRSAERGRAGAPVAQPADLTARDAQLRHGALGVFEYTRSARVVDADCRSRARWRVRARVAPVPAARRPADEAESVQDKRLEVQLVPASEIRRPCREASRVAALATSKVVDVDVLSAAAVVVHGTLRNRGEATGEPDARHICSGALDALVGRRDPRKCSGRPPARPPDLDVLVIPTSAAVHAVDHGLRVAGLHLGF